MATTAAQVTLTTTQNTGSLQTFATDAAYVTAKGSAAANGDVYYNTTYDAFRGYQGGAWGFLKRGPLPSMASDAAYVTAKGSAAANGDEYYNSTAHVVRRYENSAWVSAFNVPGVPCSSYLGLKPDQTTVANDSISITGHDHTALAADAHVGYIVLPHHTTAGKLSVFTVSADVKVKLTGAHWGMGTLGDFAGIIHRVYAVNDTGTLKYMVTNSGGLRTIVDTNTSTTQTNITTQAKGIVNSALNAGTWPCFQLGWFTADFDDTGGSSEDLWAVSTTIGTIGVGTPAPVYTDWASIALTCGLTGGTNTVTAYARQLGDMWHVRGDALFNPVFTGGTATLTFPANKLIDTSKVPGTPVASVSPAFGRALCHDVGTDSFDAIVLYSSTTAVIVRAVGDDAGTGSSFNNTKAVDTTSPFTWANSDRMYFEFMVPIRGWSTN